MQPAEEERVCSNRGPVTRSSSFGPSDFHGVGGQGKGSNRRLEASVDRDRGKLPEEPLEGSNVRTIHGKGPTRYFLRTLRSQPVWLSVHRDGAPAAGTSARRQGAHQSVPAVACLGGIYPEADRSAH